mgnify:CR=1 FL=1
MEKVVRQTHSILYWLKRETDSQFAFWEEPIQVWAKNNGIIDETEATIPQQFDNIHLPEFTPKVAFSEIINERKYKPDELITITLRDLGSRFPLTQADYFLNSNFLGSIKQPPFLINFKLSDLETRSVTNELKVVIYDSVRNQTNLTTEILSE